MDDSITQIKKAIEKTQPALEGRRKKLVRYFVIAIVITVIMITALFIHIAGSLQNAQILIVILSFVSSTLIFYILNMYYRASTTKLFLRGLEEKTDLTWNKKGVFPLAELQSHRIVPPHSSHEITNGFQGFYKNIPLSFQEVRLTDNRPDPNDKKKQVEFDVFWGFIVRIKLRKPLYAHTIIIPNSKFQTFFRTAFSDLKKINLVSTTFERKYDVLGTDQVEGRVILDPAFIERFMATGDMLKSKWIEASFKDNEVVFLIQRGRPLFDIGHIWTTLSNDYLQKTLKDVNAVLRIIDVLKLNPQVGI